VQALAAGADALCLGADLSPEQVEGAHGAIVDAVQAGRLDEERLLEAAGRAAALAARTARGPRTTARPGSRPARARTSATPHRRRALVLELWLGDDRRGRGAPRPRLRSSARRSGCGKASRCRRPATAPCSSSATRIATRGSASFFRARSRRDRPARWRARGARAYVATYGARPTSRPRRLSTQLAWGYVVVLTGTAQPTERTARPRAAGVRRPRDHEHVERAEAAGWR
jgi:hypothetical protein